jgi:hypothetical protein
LQFVRKDDETTRDCFHRGDHFDALDMRFVEKLPTKHLYWSYSGWRGEYKAGSSLAPKFVAFPVAGEFLRCRLKECVYPEISQINDCSEINVDIDDRSVAQLWTRDESAPRAIWVSKEGPFFEERSVPTKRQIESLKPRREQVAGVEPRRGVGGGRCQATRSDPQRTPRTVGGRGMLPRPNHADYRQRYAYRSLHAAGRLNLARVMTSRSCRSVGSSISSMGLRPPKFLFGVSSHR